MRLVALQPSLNRGSEGLGGHGSDGFFRKIVPRADGREDEGRVLWSQYFGVSSEYSGLWYQDSLSELDLNLALLDQGGFGHSESQLKGVKV